MGEEGEAEQEEEKDLGSREANVIYNAEEVEAEQSEMPGAGSGPNMASPFVRM